MGIIAGIYYLQEKKQGSNDILLNMIKVQSHRDETEPDVYHNEKISLGMSNKHDSIFLGKNNNRDLAQTHENKLVDIKAIVDGIVLDIPKHINFFEKAGYSIPHPTCSSIVAIAYEHWGLDFMHYLEGEFTCSIYDKKNNSLILARDPYGHKPLHYYSDRNNFFFSSEIKGILAAGVQKDIDLVSLSDFLSLNCIPYPATIFKNIFQVPPGTMMVINESGIKSIEYWSPKLSVDTSVNFEDAVSEISIRLQNAVKKRMITDDVYCFLSGGIDSSAVVSFASEISGKKVHAVSVGFAEEEANELEDAAIMAKHVGAEHHQVIATPGSFFDMLDTMVFHHDSPFTDTSAYPTYYAGKLAREFADIILTGDGPDQTMGGSSHHVFAIKDNTFAPRNALLQNLKRFGAGLSGLFINAPTPSLLSKIQRKLYRDSLSPVHAAYDVRSYFPDLVKKFLCTDDFWNVHLNSNPYRHPESWFKEVEGIDDINRHLYADIKFYVPDDLMIKVDRMCMASGLETLSPFQDIGLAEIVNKLPGHFKIHQSISGDISTKYILKKVCESRFPKHTLTKKKQGFGIPIEKWLKQNNGKFIKEILLDEQTLKRGFFKRQSIEKVVDIFIDNKGDYFFPSPSGMVALLTLELWNRRYVD
jgi:asparagine synthase (glutamine-hydrolysing)